MFLAFFYTLRQKGISVSLTEWLALLEGLKRNLHNSTMSGFYSLCRAVLVKSEADFDVFDEVFLEYFKDVSMKEEIPQELLDWLNKPDLSNEFEPWFMDENEIDHEAIEKSFHDRLEDQDEEHNGGCKWIGTQGHNAHGHHGNELGGIRVGGESVYHSAYRVATERKYRDWRKDNTLDSRQFQMAFRSLRQLSDHSIQPKTELDVDQTIQKTSDKGGNLQIVMKAPRKNVIKLLLLIDSGGSMEPYQKLCSMLFQSVSKAGNFDDLKIYYFHNYLEKYLFETPELSWDKVIPTDWVLDNLNETYRVIFVGDAVMSIDELYAEEWEKRGRKAEKTGYKRFQEFKRKYPHIIWLYPQSTPSMETYWTKTFFLLRDMFPMYRLTLDGLTQGVKKLLSAR